MPGTRRPISPSETAAAARTPQKASRLSAVKRPVTTRSSERAASSRAADALDREFGTLQAVEELLVRAREAEEFHHVVLGIEGDVAGLARSGTWIVCRRSRTSRGIRRVSPPRPPRPESATSSVIGMR